MSYSRENSKQQQKSKSKQPEQSTNLVVPRPKIFHQHSAASNTSSSSFGSLFTHRNAHSQTSHGDSYTNTHTSSAPSPATPIVPQEQAVGTADSNRILARYDMSSVAPDSPSFTHGHGQGLGHRRSSSTPAGPTPRPASSASVDDIETLDSASTYIGASPRRIIKSNSLKRKPVPQYIVHNQNLPSSHPFANITPPHSRSHSPASLSKHDNQQALRPPSLLSVGTERTSPISSRSASPSVGGAGVDRGMGRTPPPPLRKPFAVPAVPARSADRGVPADNAAGVMDSSSLREGIDLERDGQRRSTFNGTLQEFLDKSDYSAEEIRSDYDSEQVQTPTQQSQSRVVSLDRPLPALPAGTEHRTVRSISRPGTPPRRRSVSAESLGAPLTPHAPTSGVPVTISPTTIVSDYDKGATSLSSQSDKASKAYLRAPRTLFTRRSTEKAKKTSSASTPAADPRGKRLSMPLSAQFAGYEAEEELEFSVDRVPSKQRLWEASTCLLRDEEGNLISFGDLLPRYAGQKSSPTNTAVSSPMILHGSAVRKGKGKTKEMNQHVAPVPAPDAQPRSQTPIAGIPPMSPPLGEPASKDMSRGPSAPLGPTPKTVIFFIRHFWCGQCQDYTFASLSLLDPVVLEKAGIKVIIISNGSWKIIKSYKSLFNCPFPIYVDGPRRLYQLMGMTKMTNDFGPMFKGRASYHQRPVPTQLLHGLSNAFFRMPLANPGTLTQLGGEFILSPGWKCDFAHRMTTTSDHMEAPDVLRLAGCEYPTKSEVADIQLAESQKEELARLEEEMQAWRDGRHQEIERIRQKKAERRGETYVPERRPSAFELTSNVLADGAGADDAELDKRFEKVMRLEEEREKVKMATEQLMFSREKGDLEVEVDPKEMKGTA